MNAEQGRGQVITFYSYKGGTGRTMALANVACLLASEQAANGGKPVLAIDWDLEAPGLHRYFEPFLGGRSETQEGLIELFEDLRDRVRPGCAPDEEEEMSEEVVATLDVKRFAVPTSYPKLSFLQAGRFDDTYSTRTNTFAWPELFKTAPSLFRMLAERLAEEFSFVLIDSRTGITDTSGICTTLMPEKLVVVFTPNRQSLTGITDLVERSYAYRRGSDDVRPLIVYPLPSRIETSVPDEMRRWRLGDEREGIRGWEMQFTELLRGVYELPENFSLEHYFDDVQAQHVPPYAYGEPIAVLRERGSERLTLTKSYDTFRGYLVRNAPWDDSSSKVDEAARQATLERLNRLNEEFRAATEAVRPPVVASMPMPSTQPGIVPSAYPTQPGTIAAPRRAPMVLLGLAVIAILVIAGLVAWRLMSSAALVGPAVKKSQVLTRVVADADENRPSTSVLLLASLLDDVDDSEKRVVREQLIERLERIPAPAFRVPVAGTADLSLLGDRLLILGADGKLTRIDVTTGDEFMDVPAGVFAAAAERPDGSIATVTEEGVLSLYDANRVTATQRLDKRGFFRFGPAGQLLVHSSPKGDATIWSIEGGYGAAMAASARPNPRARVAQRAAVRPAGIARLLHQIDATGQGMPGGVFSADGSTVIVSHSGGSLAVDRSGWISKVLRGAREVTVDASGQRGAGVIAGRTVVYDIRSGKQLSTFAAVPNLVIDPAGKTLLGIIPVNTVARFDAQSGDQTGVLPYTSGTLRFVDFLEDGRVITILDDRIQVGQPLAQRDFLTIEPPGKIVETVHEGHLLVVAGEDAVRGWRLDAQVPAKTASDEELVAEACRRAGRDLTDQEWTTYFESATRKPVCGAETEQKLAPKSGD
jgi:cellulose biosynthesis protein BcsQ